MDEKRRQSEGAEEEDMDEDDIEEVDSDEWDEDDEDEEEEPIARTDCFFCLHHSSNMEKNAIHMATEHSFFIPDVEYLVDMPGLFEYLGAKVKVQIFLLALLTPNQCFWVPFAISNS